MKHKRDTNDEKKKIIGCNKKSQNEKKEEEEGDDWLNECTNKFPGKVIDSMEFDVTCWKKREEKGKKTREKER